MALTTLALIGLAASDAQLVRTGQETRLVTSKGEYRVEATSLSWAPNGRRLALWSEGGALKIWGEADGKDTQVSARAFNPRWSPDGSQLLFLDQEKGLTAVAADGGTERHFAEDAERQAAAWSSDGTRIAFATKDSIFTINSDGSNRRRIMRGQPVSTLAWHPDGRTIAFVKPGLKGIGSKLILLGTVDNTPRAVANLEADYLDWSPDGKLLLAGSGAKYTVVSLETGKKQPLPTTLGRPQWQGSKKLLFATRDGLFAGLPGENPQKLGSPWSEPPLVWAGVPQVEISGDTIFKSPFSRLAKPAPGFLRIEGFIDSADPLKGECSVFVTSITGNSGYQTFLSKGVSQKVAISDKALKVIKGDKIPFRMLDLRSDVEVSMVVEGETLTSGGALVGREIAFATPESSVAPLLGAPRLIGAEIEYDGVSRENIVVPLVFPVVGQCRWSDSFLADRDGGARRHHGQDLMAPKMTPIVAVFDGVVQLGRPRTPGGQYTLTLKGDNGWVAKYYHINNDTPGTDDGQGTDETAYAPGLESGQRVKAGQFIAYVGDSGNAESTAPHLHFELWDSVTSAVVNAAPSLQSAQKLANPQLSVSMPSVKLNKGEIRYDGIVREVDRDRGVLRVALISETPKGGRTKTVTAARSLWVKLSKATDAHVLGNENLQVKMEDLNPGLYAVVVAPAKSSAGAIQPRVAAFAPRE